VLTEVVSKRMEAVPKLTLIQQLGVVPVRENDRRLTTVAGWLCAARLAQTRSAVLQPKSVEWAGVAYLSC